MLKNLNFTKADFTNYEKIKLIIFKDNFIKNNKEPSVFNFDFINYAYKIGGKNGIKIAKQNIINWQIKNYIRLQIFIKEIDYFIYFVFFKKIIRI